MHIAAALASLSMSILLIFLAKYKSNSRTDLNAVQTSHLRPTSRLGGIAVAFGIFVGIVTFQGKDISVILEIAICATPVFVAGVLEDIGLRVSARGRLIASICSSAVAIGLFGISIAHLGFPELDFIIQNSVVASLLTIIALAGICHAFNIIDGLHGLCGFASIIIGAALAQVAVNAGQPELAQVIWVVLAAVAGFLALNYPRGLLFLGDSGAYVIGFALGCMAVHLMVYNGDVSPWALLLVFFWPIADTLLALSRRVNRGSSALIADRMHFHQVMMRTLEICVLGKNKRVLANPIATLLLLPMIALPSVMGILLWNQSGPALMMIVVDGILFVLTYRTCINLAQSRGKKMTRKTRVKVIKGFVPVAEIAP